MRLSIEILLNLYKNVAFCCMPYNILKCVIQLISDYFQHFVNIWPFVDFMKINLFEKKCVSLLVDTNFFNIWTYRTFQYPLVGVGSPVLLLESGTLINFGIFRESGTLIMVVLLLEIGEYILANELTKDSTIDDHFPKVSRELNNY